MSDARELFSESIHYLRNKDYKAARQLLNQLNMIVSNSDQILALLATAEFELGDYEFANRHAEQALSLNAKSVEALQVKGAYEYKKENHLTSIECYEQIIELEPGNTGAWKQLFTILNAKKLFPRALELTPRILTLSNEDHELKTLVAIIYYNSELYEEASKLLLDVFYKGERNQSMLTYLLLSLAKEHNEPQFDSVAKELIQIRNTQWLEIIVLALDEAKLYNEAIRFFYLLIEKKYAFSALLLNAYGLLFEKLNNKSKALECLLAANTLEPNNELYAVNLSLLYVDIDEIGKAISLLTMLAESGAQSPDVYGNLGALLNRVGRLKESEEIILKGLSIAANYKNPTLHYNLGNTYMSMGDSEKSINQFKKAIDCDSTYHAAYINLSSILTKQGCIVDAESILFRYRDLKGETKEFLNNLGCLRREQMNLEEAISLLRRSVDSDFENHDVHKNLSFGLLLTGNFAEGFKEYEWRRKNKDFLKLDGTEWGGKIEPGKRLLIHSEQGIGDDFQFLRFLRHINNKGMTLIGVIRDELVEFVKRRGFFDEVYPLTSFDRSQINYDYYLPIGSIPYKLKLFKPSDYKMDFPYISALSSESTIKGNEFSVGLVWSGNPKHTNDANRSIPIKKLAPLFENNNVNWCNLQKGAYEEQIYSEYPQISIQPLNREIKTWEDTARILNELDCIVTVDTSVAHLAGAMGKKVLLLISYSPDWRWGLPRKEVQWYPNLELFRQESYKDWDSVINKVTERLNNLIKMFKLDKNADYFTLKKNIKK